jgi:hypothetical protein
LNYNHIVNFLIQNEGRYFGFGARLLNCWSISLRCRKTPRGQ